MLEITCRVSSLKMGRGSTLFSTTSSSRKPSKFPFQPSKLQHRHCPPPYAYHSICKLDELHWLFLQSTECETMLAVKRGLQTWFNLALCRTYTFACKIHSWVTWNPFSVQNTSSNNTKLPQNHTQESGPITIALEALSLVGEAEPV
jgi:hypothetical protein